MRLVEFTRFNGTKIAINPEYVIEVAPSVNIKNETTLRVADHTFDIRESYADVTRVLTGASVGRDERGRFSVRGAV